MAIGTALSTTARRYPLENATAQEADRLAALQTLHARGTTRRLEALGVGPGWDCAELGAGAGSVAVWLSERVGADGSVTAVDQDTSLLGALAARPNVRVVQGDLSSLDLGREVFDLVHSRSVLMHLDDPDGVVARAVAALRPGGWVFFEEADGAPVLHAVLTEQLPDPFVRVMVPLAARWTWARSLADRVAALGMVEVRDDTNADRLEGGTPAAAFWRQTLVRIRPLVTDRARMRSLGAEPADDDTYDAMLALLDDPGFSVPVAARHRVSARHP